jgi:hypothetical protein
MLDPTINCVWSELLSSQNLSNLSNLSKKKLLAEVHPDKCIRYGSAALTEWSNEISKEINNYKYGYVIYFSFETLCIRFFSFSATSRRGTSFALIQDHLLPTCGYVTQVSIFRHQILAMQGCSIVLYRITCNNNRVVRWCPLFWCG